MKKIHSFQSISTLCCSETASGRAWCWMRERSVQNCSLFTLLITSLSFCHSFSDVTAWGQNSSKEGCALLTHPERCKPVVTSEKLICLRKINGSPPSLLGADCDPRLAWLCPSGTSWPCPQQVLEASAGFEKSSNCQWWIYHHTYESLWKHRQWRGDKGGNKAAQHNQWFSRHECVWGSSRKNKLQASSLQY